MINWDYNNIIITNFDLSDMIEIEIWDLKSDLSGFSYWFILLFYSAGIIYESFDNGDNNLVN